MHNDITKTLHESEHRDHKIIIVERNMQGRVFLYFYVLGKSGNECGGMYYGGYSNVTEKDLEDLSICVPKIKLCIDDSIALHEKYEKEKLEKKLKMKWTGRCFKRGDFVHYKGDKDHMSVDTHVWTHFGHCGLEYYVIEHPQGKDRIHFINKPPYRRFGVGADGFEAIHSSTLQNGLKYLALYCNEFQGETDELVMIKESTSNDIPTNVKYSLE